MHVCVWLPFRLEKDNELSIRFCYDTFLLKHGREYDDGRISHLFCYKVNLSSCWYVFACLHLNHVMYASKCNIHSTIKILFWNTHLQSMQCIKALMVTFLYKLTRVIYFNKSISDYINNKIPIFDKAQSDTSMKQE